MSTLEIKDLHVSVILDDENTKPILKGVNLTIKSGEIHAIMGPNGSSRGTRSIRLTPARFCLMVKTSPR